MTIDSENYFDIAEALHAVLTLWHGGQYSETYALLCKSQFKPGALWSETQVENENEYFPELEEWAKNDEIEKLAHLMNEIELFLENNE